MNYLYSQECIGNSTEGCCGGFFIPGVHSFLTYNRNIVRLWKYKDGLVLVKEHIALENVCRVEKYALGDRYDGFVFLFDRAKITLVKYNPVINDFEMKSLKCFEKDKFDIREEDVKNIRITTNMGMVQLGKYHFGVFALHPNTFSARVFRFVDVDVKVRNPIDFVFLENYSIPTVCLVYDSSPRKYTSVKGNDAVIFSIDLSSNDFHMVDEFMTPPGTFKVSYSGSILLFLSHNSVLVRSTNSSYTLALNKMSESYGSSEMSREVVLSDAVCFFKGKSCLIFNGNRDRYKLRVVMDIKRIIGASLQYEGRDSAFTCVGYVDGLVFLGSIGDSSKLLRVKDMAHSNEDDEDTDGEYRRVFGPGPKINKEGIAVSHGDEHSDTSPAAEEDFVLEKLDEIPNVGFLGGMFMRKSNEAVFSCDGLVPCICVLNSSITLEVVKSVKIRRYMYCSKALDFYLLGNNNESKVFVWNENLEYVEGGYKRSRTLLFMEFGSGIVQVTSNACSVLDTALNVANETGFDEQILEATVVSDVLILRDAAHRMFCYDSGMNVITTVSDVACFTCIGEKIFVLSGGELIVFDLNKRINVLWSGPVNNLPPIMTFSTEASTGLELEPAVDMIVEMCCFSTGSKILLLLRSRDGLMAAYESFDPHVLLGESVMEAELVFFRVKLPRCTLFDLGPDEKAFYPTNDAVFMRSIDMLMFPTDKGYFLYKNQYSLTCVFGYKDQILQLSKGHLALCALPSGFKKDVILCDGFVVRKIPMERIPKHVEYVDGYIAVASCEEVPFASGESCGVPVYTYKFYVDLYSSKYEHISTYELGDNEHVFQMRYLILDDKQGNDGKSPFLVVCATLVEGEDKPAKGRLHVLEVISVVPELEKPFKDRKLKILGVEKTKGSIVQCEEVRGNIVLCLGTKIMIYKVDRSSGIIPIGFYDLHIFTSSISVVKNYILAADIYRGMSFFYFQSKPVRLHLISSSVPLRNATTLEFIITDDELSMLCCDNSGTIHIYTYSPNNILSLDGTRLVKRAEMRTKLGRLFSNRMGFRGGSVMLYSGSNILVQVSGVQDICYYRLLGLQASIVSHLRNTFGLNPRDYLDSDIHLHSLSLKSPIVLHILNEFFCFDLKIQEAVSMASGMSRRDAMDLIASLDS